MPRLILGLLLFAVIVMAVTSVARFMAQMGRLPAPNREDAMPAVFRNVAYGLLITLMFGIATGWLGGL